MEFPKSIAGVKGYIERDCSGVHAPYMAPRSNIAFNLYDYSQSAGQRSIQFTFDSGVRDIPMPPRGLGLLAEPISCHDGSFYGVRIAWEDTVRGQVDTAQMAGFVLGQLYRAAELPRAARSTVWAFVENTGYRC
jgi:hypothetical protein